MAKVVILGGGVAGMSAAHELIERGFEVEVYERNLIYPGGKARSVEVAGTNLQDPELFLPGEHGFRFFPGFYKHVTDTMQRIPFTDANGRKQKLGCFGNLVSTSRIMMARNEGPPIVALASFPRTWNDWKTAIRTLTKGVKSGLTKEEKSFFLKKMWQLMTSSTNRRAGEYEQIGWWYYLEADRFSETYRHLLVEGLTRTLVASRAKSASTKTGGDIFLQLVYTMLDPSAHTDRVLDGPTNDRWLTPWLKYLEDKGVKYHLGHRVAGIRMKDGKIASASIVTPAGIPIVATGDYFILATPVERAAPLLSADILAADPNLQLIKELAESVSWMNGIQFYLNEDVEISNGHVIYSDSDWAVTSISQIQFWKGYDLSKRYNGKVKGILSVDISDWLWTEYKGRLAENCSPAEVKELVWQQMKDSLNTGGRELLRDDMIEFWYLDRDIQYTETQGHGQSRDVEPLLVNTVDSWRLRPNAVTEIPNFFLAADYVRTNTDLATMEGANEAARRAVNGILIDSGSTAAPCRIWPLSEPALFSPIKWWDRSRFDRGLPYSSRLPWWLFLVMVVWGLIYVVIYIFKWIISLFARR